MKNQRQIYFCILLIFLCQNSISRECVRFAVPFKSFIKRTDVAIAGEVIYSGEHRGGTFAKVKVTERFFGNCQDTIYCFNDDPWELGFMFVEPGDKFIMVLHQIDSFLHYTGSCGTYKLYFNDQENKYSGNITHFNGFLNRYPLSRISKRPINHMDYQKIKKIIKRKGRNKDSVMLSN